MRHIGNKERGPISLGWVIIILVFSIEVPHCERNQTRSGIFKEWIEQRLVVADEVVSSFFENLFTSKGLGDTSYLLFGIEKHINASINFTLTARYIEEEIVATLKCMGPTKAPEKDGFLALFFQRYWYIISGQVSRFYLSILNNDDGLIAINEREIILIPKS